MGVAAAVGAVGRCRSRGANAACMQPGLDCRVRSFVGLGLHVAAGGNVGGDADGVLIKQGSTSIGADCRRRVGRSVGVDRVRRRVPAPWDVRVWTRL